MDQVRERPILFSGSMVRAIIDGKKSMTRRPIKRPKDCPADYILTPSVIITPGITWWRNPEFDRVGRSHKCPFGKPGDSLWVRERLNVLDSDKGSDPEVFGQFIQYAADEQCRGWTHDEDALGGALYPFNRKSVPSIHMPRWASRITLKITDVHVERLNEISEADAIAEGITPGRMNHGSQKYDVSIDGGSYDFYSPVKAFTALWESINGPDSWAVNPWVWVVSFEVIP